jgi:hypothetical protein
MIGPPDFVLPHRSPGVPWSSQTAGSNAASGLSGWRAYASAVACSSASQSAFKIAARTNSDRRRERAGAIRSKRLANSSSTSTRSDFIGSSIYLTPSKCPQLRSEAVRRTAKLGVTCQRFQAACLRTSGAHHELLISMEPVADRAAGGRDGSRRELRAFPLAWRSARTEERPR